MNAPGTNTGHGHVWSRPDGVVALCGGPGFCIECARDLVGDGITDDMPPEVCKKVAATINELQAIIDREKDVGLIALGVVMQKIQMQGEGHRV